MTDFFKNQVRKERRGITKKNAQQIHKVFDVESLKYLVVTQDHTLNLQIIEKDTRILRSLSRGCQSHTIRRQDTSIIII